MGVCSPSGRLGIGCRAGKSVDEMALFGRIEATTHSRRQALAFLTLGGRAPMVCGVLSGSGADGVAWSAPDRVARCFIGRGVPVFLPVVGLHPVRCPAFLPFFCFSSGSTGRRAAPSFFAGRAVPGSFYSRVLYYNKVNNKGDGFKVFTSVNKKRIK